jgi:hypothetical protein
MTTTVERLRTTLAGLILTAIDARLETLLENASKKEPSYGDFLLKVMSADAATGPPPLSGNDCLPPILRDGAIQKIRIEAEHVAAAGHIRIVHVERETGKYSGN